MSAPAGDVVITAIEQEQAGFLVALALEVVTQVGRGVGRKVGGEPVNSFEDRQDGGPGLRGTPRGSRGGGLFQLPQRIEEGLFGRGHGREDGAGRGSTRTGIPHSGACPGRALREPEVQNLKVFGENQVPSLRFLRSLCPKSKRAGLQAHVNAADMSAGRGGICHKERRERRDLEGRDRLPRSTHPHEVRKTGEAYSWESIIPFLRNRLSVLKDVFRCMPRFRRVAFFRKAEHGMARMQFSLFGFPVRVELWFVITAVLLGGGLRPEAYSSVANLAGIGIWVIVVFFSILVHEFGHATTGRKYGANPEIVLHAFGGAAVMHGARFTRSQDLLVTAAGPIASVVLGTIALLMFRYAPISSPEIRETLLDLVWINYFWTLINLLPIQPLDGGLLLRTGLGDRRLHITCMVGFVAAAGVALLALLSGRVFLTLLMAMLAFENWRMRPR